MGNSRPVSTFEVWFHVWPVSLLIIVALGRLLWGWLAVQQIWLSNMQILAVCLLLAALLLAGTLPVPRAYSGYLTFIFGLGAWLVLLSLLPPRLWSGYSYLRQPVALWVQVSAGALVIVAFFLRAWLARRWLEQLRGHGFDWMVNWAREQPLYARLLAQRVLASLGYNFDAEQP
jgi:hypothetical protein